MKYQPPFRTWLKRKLQVDTEATNISISAAVQLNFKLGNQSLSTLTFCNKPKLKLEEMKEIDCKNTGNKNVYGFKWRHIYWVLTGGLSSVHYLWFWMPKLKMVAKNEERRKLIILQKLLPSTGSSFNQMMTL